MLRLKHIQKEDGLLSKDKYITHLLSIDYQSPGEHIANIIAKLPQRFLNKYDMGQEEHGGKLWRKQCLVQLEEELIDALIYFKVIQHQVELARHVLMDAMTDKISYEDAVDMAYNILEWGNVWGNPSGEEEEQTAIKEDIGELELGISCLYEDMKGLKKKQKSARRKKTSQS
jgi:hypothetical protein